MTTALVPRHDLDAEAAVLSAVLLDASALDRVRGSLEPEAFYSPAHRRVWEAVCHLSDHAQPVDVLTVASWLKSRERLVEVGGAAWLAKLVDAAPSVANVEAYAETIATAALQRRVVAECQRAVAEGYGDVGDVRAWAGAVEERLAGLTTGSAERKAAFVGDVVRDVFEQARDGSKAKRVLMGLRSLDAALSCHAGDLVIVAARPGMGKTALVGGVGVTVGLTEAPEEHTASLIFSAEMDRVQIAQRLLAGDAKVPLSALRHSNVGDYAWASLTQSAQRLDGCALVLDDMPAPKLAHVRSVIRETKRNLARWPTGTEKPRALRLVIVDYLQIMGTDAAKGKNREQEISELSRGLKEIARTEGVVMVALSQLNRGVEARANKRPLLSDLRESGAIEQDADAIVFVYRDEYYNPKGPKGVAELLIAKNRNGSTGRAFVKFEGVYTLFSDLSESEEEQLRRESKEDLQMTEGELNLVMATIEGKLARGVGELIQQANAALTEARKALLDAQRDMSSVVASRDALAAECRKRSLEDLARVNACAVPPELARLYAAAQRARGAWGAAVQTQKLAEECGEYVAECSRGGFRHSVEKVEHEIHDVLTVALSLAEPELMAKAAERLEGRLK